MKRCCSRQVDTGIVCVCVGGGGGRLIMMCIEQLGPSKLIIYLELAEMEVQKEEVQRLETEVSEAEETLEKERTKSKGTY